MPKTNPLPAFLRVCASGSGKSTMTRNPAQSGTTPTICVRPVLRYLVRERAMIISEKSCAEMSSVGFPLGSTAASCPMLVTFGV